MIKVKFITLTSHSNILLFFCNEETRMGFTRKRENFMNEFMSTSAKNTFAISFDQNKSWLWCGQVFFIRLARKMEIFIHILNTYASKNLHIDQFLLLKCNKAAVKMSARPIFLQSNYSISRSTATAVCIKVSERLIV